MNKESNYIMEIVYGNDIIKYYNRANQDAEMGTGLYCSCMNYTSSDDIKAKQIEFYAKNDNVGLLILKLRGAEKIRGRAFIWTTTTGQKYIDYTYTTNSYETYLYRKYAEDNQCLTRNNMDSCLDLVIKCNADVAKLNDMPPYLDTFKYYKEENIIRGNHSYKK